MRYNGLVLCWVLVITYLIIHECPRHHCNCYTSEIRPTPHFAASTCSYCYVNALSDVVYTLPPFTDSREVICGSWAPRLFCRPALHSLTQIFTHHKISFCVFAEEVLILRLDTMRWLDSRRLACTHVHTHRYIHTHILGPHFVYVCVCVCTVWEFSDYTTQ